MTEDHTPDINDTVAALEAGLTSLTPSAALAVIDRWHDACAAYDEFDLTDVAEGLSDLRDLLGGDRLDGRAIAATLARLADATTLAATQAEDARMTPALERLGTVLGATASALGA